MTKVEVLILNPSFDPPYTARTDPEHGGSPANEVSVAQDWQPYYTPQEPDDPPWKHRRPEWTQYQHWQKVFGTNATIQGGVYQRVQVAIGDLLTLVVHACFTSSNSGVALRVGIDPYGGTDFQSSEVQWGHWHGETAPEDSPGYWEGGLDNPRFLSVENIEPEAPYVTLFLHIENIAAHKDESAFWDQATLYREGDPDPEPPKPGEGWEELLVQVTRIADAVEKIAGE
jgi:hypothetical protein